MTTYDPDKQEQNHRVLRDVVRKFGGTLALDTAAIRQGRIAVGDKVEFLAEVEGLCGGYQLDARHAVCVIEDLGVLQRRVQPRGHEIFPVHSTGRDEV